MDWKSFFHSLDKETFLPGITIENGYIIIDKTKLTYPGDILHEAGHVAVVPSSERQTLNAKTIEKRPDRAAEEMMAIAWSYAASVHLELAPEFVFHHGYKNGGNYLIENFTKKQYVGVPMLQWLGLTVDEKNAKKSGEQPYPAMLKWLRD